MSTEVVFDEVLKAKHKGNKLIRVSCYSKAPKVGEHLYGKYKIHDVKEEETEHGLKCDLTVDIEFNHNSLWIPVR